ncbi:MAG: ribonuclease III [Gammaproteobacteria bacterium]|nr:ribonuclease III [Gammaproteobacteria bacterium]
MCRKLEYKFINPEHLYLALTHRSASGYHNERSEFLGDSVLNFVIAQALYDAFPKATEGDLSRYRATLVRKEALAEIARELELGNYIRLGSGELKSGGYRRDSILADTVEAIIASVLLDSGFDAAESLILRLYQNKITSVTEVSMKDAKSRLQEYLQSRKYQLPVYTVKTVEGEAHDQYFEVLCEIPEFQLSITGQGKSRRRAEQIAAEKALEEIGKKLGNGKIK